MRNIVHQFYSLKKNYKLSRDKLIYREIRRRCDLARSTEKKMISPLFAIDRARARASDLREFIVAALLRTSFAKSRSRANLQMAIAVARESRSVSSPALLSSYYVCKSDALDRCIHTSTRAYVCCTRAR